MDSMNKLRDRRTIARSQPPFGPRFHAHASSRRWLAQNVGRGVTPKRDNSPCMATEKSDDSLIVKHLQELKAFRDSQVVARFEVVAVRGWFRNLFAANEPWIEVRWVDDHHMHLNLVTLQPSSAIPVTWGRRQESAWLVPMDEMEVLADWIGKEWCHLRGATSMKLRMWSE
jgi:hypothetical protein